jgi:hypothetical protein
MKYANTEEMTTAHVQNIVDTCDPSTYGAHINAAFEAILRMMIIHHDSNLKLVMQDIVGLCEHFVARCVTVIEQNKPPEGTVLH